MIYFTQKCVYMTHISGLDCFSQSGRIGTFRFLKSCAAV